MIAMVTGASSGFGEAISRLLVSAGHRVIGTGRRGERLAALSEDLGEQFLPLVFDVQDKAATRAAIEGCRPNGNRWTCWSTTPAWHWGWSLPTRQTLRTGEQMIATNISGLTLITRLLLPGMVARNCGHVINIGSIAGTLPYPGGNVYGATKAFVKQFSPQPACRSGGHGGACHQRGAPACVAAPSSQRALPRRRRQGGHRLSGGAGHPAGRHRQYRTLDQRAACPRQHQQHRDHAGGPDLRSAPHQPSLMSRRADFCSQEAPSGAFLMDLVALVMECRGGVLVTPC